MKKTRAKVIRRSQKARLEILKDLKKIIDTKKLKLAAGRMLNSIGYSYVEDDNEIFSFADNKVSPDRFKDAAENESCTVCLRGAMLYAFLTKYKEETKDYRISVLDTEFDELGNNRAERTYSGDGCIWDIHMFTAGELAMLESLFEQCAYNWDVTAIKKETILMSDEVFAIVDETVEKLRNKYEDLAGFDQHVDEEEYIDRSNEWASVIVDAAIACVKAGKTLLYIGEFV
jgi:hypothetical protein